MTDEAAPLRRRIEATAGLLEYATPMEAVELAKEFLTSVFEDKEIHVDLRLDALKLVRKAEAAKMTRPSTSVADEVANREAWRRVEMARRRMKMIAEGLWPCPGWADDLLHSDYKPPHGAAKPTSFVGFAERMKAARLAQQRKSPKDQTSAEPTDCPALPLEAVGAVAKRRSRGHRT